MAGLEKGNGASVGVSVVIGDASIEGYSEPRSVYCVVEPR